MFVWDKKWQNSTRKCQRQCDARNRGTMNMFLAAPVCLLHSPCRETTNALQQTCSDNIQGYTTVWVSVPSFYYLLCPTYSDACCRCCSFFCPSLLFAFHTPTEERAREFARLPLHSSFSSNLPPPGGLVLCCCRKRRTLFTFGASTRKKGCQSRGHEAARRVALDIPLVSCNKYELNVNTSCTCKLLV